MAKKVLLFAYGLLQPGRRPPRSMSAAWPDRVRGDLYDLGEYPGAVRIGTAAGWISGQTLEIDADELAELDEFEDVPGGLYERRLVETEAGHTAWIYEYTGALPAAAVAVARWPAPDRQ